MLKGASRLETCKPRGLRRGLHQEQTIMPALGQCFLILVDPSCLVFSFQSSSVSNGNPTDSPRQSSFLHFLADFGCFWLKNHMFICKKIGYLVKSRHLCQVLLQTPGSKLVPSMCRKPNIWFVELQYDCLANVWLCELGPWNTFAFLQIYIFITT